MLLRLVGNNPFRFIFLVIVATVAFTLAKCAAEPVFAHHNGWHLPGDVADWPAPARAMERGAFTYCLSERSRNYPYANISAQAKEVGDYAASRHGMIAIEVPWGPDCDVRNEMVPDAEFPCGLGSTYACIFYWGEQQRVYYRSSFNYTNLRTAICHEGGTGNTGHAAGQHEGYDDINFVSNGRTWTCMDFGTGVWRLPDFDRDRIFNAFVPDRPKDLYLVPASGGVHVRWGQERFDGGFAHMNNIRNNTNATRMTFGWSESPGSEVHWAGEFCGADWNWCLTPYDEQDRWFDAFWQGCLYARAENALTWAIPQISAPAHWTLAGCWGTNYREQETFTSYFGGQAGDFTCIAWRESRFNNRAVGLLGEVSQWQIYPGPDFNGDGVGDYHEATLGPAGWAAVKSDYRAAAQYSARIYRDSGFRPWSTSAGCGLTGSRI